VPDRVDAVDEAIENEKKLGASSAGLSAFERALKLLGKADGSK